VDAVQRTLRASLPRDPFLHPDLTGPLHGGRDAHGDALDAVAGIAEQLEGIGLLAFDRAPGGSVRHDTVARRHSHGSLAIGAARFGPEAVDLATKRAVRKLRDLTSSRPLTSARARIVLSEVYLAQVACICIKFFE
jgi:hypothetical protein